MTSAQLANEAYKKAIAFGWETHGDFDLSDVLDMAGLVAFHPTKKLARVARWTEGRLDYAKWVVCKEGLEGFDMYEFLEKHLARCDAYEIN